MSIKRAKEYPLNPEQYGMLAEIVRYAGRCAPPWFAHVPPVSLRGASFRCGFLGGKHQAWKFVDPDKGVIWTRCENPETAGKEFAKIDEFREVFAIPESDILQNDEDCWITEEWVQGNSLNDVDGQTRREQFSKLIRLYGDWVAKKRSDPAPGLTVRALRYVRRQGAPADLLAILDRVEGSIRRLSSRAATIPVHGDLTPNNVICGSPEPSIIDWERTTRRFFMFDILTFAHYEACRGRPCILDALMSGVFDTELRTLFDAAGVKFSPELMRASVLVFLLNVLYADPVWRKIRGRHERSIEGEWRVLSKYFTDPS